MKSRKQTLSRRAESLILVGLIACLGAVGLQAATQLTNFDPAAATIGNARLLSLAITQYTQNYDEKLPPTQSVAAFQNALLPFVSDPAIFDSRITGKPFIPNPAISNMSLATFTNPSDVPEFRDVMPPSTTPATIAFLDSHIERGGVIPGDPKLRSLGYARVLSLGIIQYTQDWDEILPPTNTQAAFQTAISPYVGNRQFFIDPLNGKPFVPNPAISEQRLSSITDPASTITLQSAMPYSDGVPTIAYLDDHAVHGTLQVPRPLDASHLKQIGLASSEYEGDNNEMVPPTSSYSAFETALAPYLKNPNLFVSPDTQLPYVLNPAISGVSLNSIADLTQTELARDAERNIDGTFNYVTLDGIVHSDYYFLPKSLAVGPDDQTRVLWPNANRQASLWTLAPGGTIKDTFSDFSFAAGLSIGGDSKPRILQRSDYTLYRSVVHATGAYTLDTVETDGTLIRPIQFGPYDGWTPKLLTAGTDSSSRLLWQNYDGRLALWTLSPEGDFQNNVYLYKFTGLTPLGLALGTDSLTRLLGKTTQGTTRLSLLSDSGRVTRAVTVPVQSGFTVTGLGLGTDGASRILSSDGKDHAAVVTVAPNGSTVSSVSFTLSGGGTASQIAVGKAGDLRVLWEAADGSGQLQTLTATGQQTSVTPLTPYL